MSARTGSRMLRLLLLIGALSLVALAPAAQGSNVQRSLLIQDCGPGCPEAIDFVGPNGFGWVDYTLAGPNLKVTIKLKHASPNTSYGSAFYVCGPTHATACGFFSFGPPIVTDWTGRGALINYPIPLADIAAMFGSGARTDHIDLLGADGSVYAAGISYTIP